MKVLFHCRGCNEQGEKEISLPDLLEARKANETLLELILQQVSKEHGCDKLLIGIRIKDE